MKAEKTKAFIIEKVAPLFNKKGYVGTSMSEITSEVNMTKGAIYGNFKNKEALAISAFEYNVRKAIFPVFTILKDSGNSRERLYQISNYFRNYYEIVIDLGGCPLQRVGIDAKYHNPVLFEMARDISNKIVETIRIIIEQGIERVELKNSLDPMHESRKLYSLFQGGLLLSLNNEDPGFLQEAIKVFEEEIGSY